MEGGHVTNIAHALIFLSCLMLPVVYIGSVVFALIWAAVMVSQ